MRVVVHGDDFTVTNKQHHMDMVKTAMREWFIIIIKGVMGNGCQGTVRTCAS